MKIAVSASPYSPSARTRGRTTERHNERRITLAAILPIVSLGTMYLPTCFTLAAGYWAREEGAYAPLLLGVAALLAMRVSAGSAAPARPSPTGIVVFILGILALLLGRLLGNMTIEAGSALLTIPGLFAAISGWRAVRPYVYPLLITSVAVPLPGSVITALTFPLKMMVSRITEILLLMVGLPVAREGVILDVGDYRLLVADACSGLQSLFSLAATALIYLSLTGQRSRGSALVLLMSVVPIALMANVVRVFALALITVFLGERAGQGFLHGFAGMLMFVWAFVALMLVDRAQTLLVRRGE